ncbi:amidase signature domain-containing protein [Chaetomium sp. MPI-CAGE-AT-0009]|nr:amidase signature domain-containing protein [Chaetomium sp. MPI-CAGE-AT-0009]
MEDPCIELSLNLLTATAADLRRLLEAGEYTSVDLVKLYLAQITAHDHAGMKLHAMIATAPTVEVLEEARALTRKHLQRGLEANHVSNSPLRDLIATPSFGMGTTSRSFALQGLTAKKDATIATLLKKAGCIVLGKSNLSEWSNSKGFDVTSGWSPVGGQTQSPYLRRGLDPRDVWLDHSTPAGSSSGSAVAAAAGFAPICIGTEADGSIVQPAIRAALYSMKGTVGSVNMVGTQSGGAAWDSAGLMAKSVEDCADVMETLLPGRDFRSSLKSSWKGIRIALLNYDKWQWDDENCKRVPEYDDQHKQELANAMKTIEALGGRVVYDAPLMMLDDIVEKYKTVTMGALSRHQLSFVIKRYLAIFDQPGLRTLKDLVEWNKEHAEVELPPEQPSQAVLENGLKDTMTDEEYHRGLKHFRQSVRNSVEALWGETDTDIIIGTGESLLTTTAAAAGYPIATVPLGLSTFNGRPFGLELVARAGAETEYPMAKKIAPLYPFIISPTLHPCLIGHRLQA